MALKLSASDKQTIVELYQHPDESTATLASRYGVSSSTISRILKQGLSPDQYKAIVQQKKGGGSKPQLDTPKSKPKPALKSEKGSHPVKDVIDKADADSSTDEQASQMTLDTQSVTNESQPQSSSPRRSRTRKRTSSAKASSKRATTKPQKSASPSEAKSPPSLPLNEVSPNDESDSIPPTDDEITKSVSPVLRDAEKTDHELEQADELVHDLETDLLVDEEFGGDSDELDEDVADLEDELLDGDDEFDDDDATDTDLSMPLTGDLLAVLPFAEARLPRTCYIIIDRSAELITRPLKTFGELGEVPEADVNEQTLPIFDNHRVAKRFANRRTQRIVKIPDAQVLRKTSTYLIEKGITRLLLDGQVYTLMDDDEEFDE